MFCLCPPLASFHLTLLLFPISLSVRIAAKNRKIKKSNKAAKKRLSSLRTTLGLSTEGPQTQPIKAPEHLVLMMYQAVKRMGRKMELEWVSRLKYV
jgi:hypothetical protein